MKRIILILTILPVLLFARQKEGGWFAERYVAEDSTKIMLFPGSLHILDQVYVFDGRRLRASSQNGAEVKFIPSRDPSGKRCEVVLSYVDNRLVKVVIDMKNRKATYFIISPVKKL
jgi:hypothetical protein